MNRPSDWYDDFVKVPTLWNAVPIKKSWKSVMFEIKSVPYIRDLARKVDNVVPFGSFGDITTISKYKPTEKAFKIKFKHWKSSRRQSRWKRSIGTSEISSRVKAQDIRSASSWPLNERCSHLGILIQERYRNVGNPILMFDFSVHTTFYHQLYGHKVSTHQYQKQRQQFLTKWIIYNVQRNSEQQQRVKV